MTICDRSQNGHFFVTKSPLKNHKGWLCYIWNKGHVFLRHETDDYETH